MIFTIFDYFHISLFRYVSISFRHFPPLSLFRRFYAMPTPHAALFAADACLLFFAMPVAARRYLFYAIFAIAAMPQREAAYAGVRYAATRRARTYECRSQREPRAAAMRASVAMSRAPRGAAYALLCYVADDMFDATIPFFVMPFVFIYADAA